MEIINKISSVVKKSDGRKSVPTICFNKSGGCVTFSMAACSLFDLKKDCRINFLSDLDRLFFYANNDKNGMRFNFFTNGQYRTKLGRAYSYPIIRYLEKKYHPKIKRGVSYLLKEFPTKTNGCRTIEILLHKKSLTNGN